MFLPMMVILAVALGKGVQSKIDAPIDEPQKTSLVLKGTYVDLNVDADEEDSDE